MLPLRLVPEKNHPFKFCDCVLRRPIVVYIFFQIHDNIYIYFIYIYMIYVVFVQHISKLKTLQNHYQQKARAPVEQNDLLAQHRSWAVDQHFQMHTILNMVVVPTPVVARHVFGISRYTDPRAS